MRRKQDRRDDENMKKKTKKKQMLELLDRSRPRPVIRQRSTVFEDRKKYKRSREKAAGRKVINEQDKKGWI